MVIPHGCKFLSVSFLALSLSKNCLCSLRSKSFDRLLMPNLNKITLKPTCSISGSVKLHKWLKREERKEFYLTAEEFKTAIDEDDVYVVDVREPFEVAKGRVPSKRFVNIPMGIIFIALGLPEEEFEKHFEVPKPQKNDKVVFMCMGGVRSTFCLGAAQDFGYKNSKHFLGGWHEWNSTYPMMKK